MPDAILILGDTNSALSAIAAKRLKIPIFHMEAGNRCFDENLPEEINRKIVDHISDVNLPYTEHARRYLLSEGIRKETTFVTGSPMAEILDKYSSEVKKSKVLSKLKLKKDGYILVSAHREENIDNEKNFISLMTALNDIAERYNLPIIYSTHPRTLDRLTKRGFKMHKLIQNLKPFGFFDYNRLQLDAFCVLSDSGTLAEESGILGFSGVSLRTSTERPEVLDKGGFVVGGISTEDIVQSIELSRAMKQNHEISLNADDYIDKNVSAKVVKIIQSYTKLINKNVWRKS
jgi:UDP-N-acetylglucosamine 2-epimerase (non-hydrolysing)